MLYLELLRQSLYHLRQYKWRSVIVILCMAWGTLSIVLLMALSTSFHRNMLNRLNAALGKNTVFFSLQKTTRAYHGYPANRTLHLTADTIMALKRTIPMIGFISPALMQTTSITARHITPIKVLILGVSADFSTLFHITFKQGHGHFFNSLDISRHQYSVVIDKATAATFFKAQQALGHTLWINSLPFRVVGISEPKEGISGPSGSQSEPWVFIPYTTFQHLWGHIDSGFNLAAPTSSSTIAALKANLQRALSWQFHIAPHDHEVFQFGDLDSFRAMTHAFFNKLNTFFLLSGLLALAIGTLGVTNIMFLMIAQRSQEIGLLMALGAQDRYILYQILMESVILVGLGSIIGCLLSEGVILILQHLSLSTLAHPVLPLSVLASSLVCLSLLGLLAGYFPARKATQLTPVDAFNKTR